MGMASLIADIAEHHGAGHPSGVLSVFFAFMLLIPASEIASLKKSYGLCRLVTH